MRKQGKMIPKRGYNSMETNTKDNVMKKYQIKELKKKQCQFEEDITIRPDKSKLQEGNILETFPDVGINFQSFTTSDY